MSPASAYTVGFSTSVSSTVEVEVQDAMSLPSEGLLVHSCW